MPVEKDPFSKVEWIILRVLLIALLLIAAIKLIINEIK